MTTKVTLGPTGQATVGSADIAANRLVCLDANGLLIVCPSGSRPIGSVQDAFKIGTLATYYKCQGQTHLVGTSGTVVKGDLIKTYTGGLALADVASGSTALSVNTIGQLVTDPDTDGNADAVLF